jgi:hypothetical protein
MKRLLFYACILAALSASSCIIGTHLSSSIGGMIIDHEYSTVEGITEDRIADAKTDLHIAYWHTSHGGQLITGIAGMDEFYGGNGWYTLNGDGGLNVSEQSPDVGAFDSSSVSNSAELFAEAVRDFLPNYPDTNVVMASWCGQIGYGSTTEDDINHYLEVISQLEVEYPGVVFVYMTGHADGGGLLGQVHRYNQIIRDYCVENDKWLYDFYDIECYDPDGEYYGDRYVTDDCNYDANNSGGTTDNGGDPGTPTEGDGNWALEWQDAHPGQWWDCSSAHSYPINANQKAKAVWQLWCAIAEEM